MAIPSPFTGYLSLYTYLAISFQKLQFTIFLSNNSLLTNQNQNPFTIICICSFFVSHQTKQNETKQIDPYFLELSSLYSLPNPIHFNSLSLSYP